jgi:hypothetical protein
MDMKMLRIGVAALLALSVSGAPAFAGELRDSVAAAATAAATEPQPAPVKMGGSSRTLMVGGAALFVSGMTYGLYQFINNSNGSYSEFGEAAATNKSAGAVGLSVAFAGGVMMLVGHHAKQMPSLTFGAKQVGLAKKVSW